MASLKHIKNLRENSTTLLNLLKDYIFGSREIKVYNENKTYQKGDLIISTTSNGKIELLQCVVDNTSGVFNATSWDHNILADFLVGKKTSAKPIILSESQPNDPTNVMWLQLVKTKDISINPSEYNTGTVIIFNADQIVGQDDQPTDTTNIKVWFDYE